MATIQGWPLFKGGVYSRVTPVTIKSCKGHLPRLKNFQAREGRFSGKEEEGSDWTMQELFQRFC